MNRKIVCMHSETIVKWVTLRGNPRECEIGWN